MGTAPTRDQRLQVAINDLVQVVMEVRDAANHIGETSTLGQLIAFHRAAWGYSLADVAEQTGLSKPHIHAMEQDRSTNPNVSTILALAKAFKVSATTVFLAAERSASLVNGEGGE